MSRSDGGASTRSLPFDVPSGESPSNDDSTRGGGRAHTISVAVAASCVENTQSLQLGTMLAGQIARSCAIFNVDEVIVLDDGPKRGPGEISAAAAHLARVLQFMETPQYLRK